jgi:tripartite ATP-independent transporter DctP family solute receptor
MWAQIDRASGGRIHTEFYPNGILGGDPALLSQVRLGALHFFVNLSNFPPVVPAVDIANVGFAFRDSDEALRAMDGPLGEYLQREFAAKGFHSLRTMWDSGMRQITTSSRPIRVADDLKDLKIRVAASRIAVDFYKTLGASPVPLSASEAYTALQTHLVDGEDAPLVTIESARWYEPQKYLSLTNHSWSGLAVVGNADFWRRLPADLQELIERTNHTYALLGRRDARFINSATGDKLGRQGLAVNKVTDSASFRARLRPYYAAWANEFGSNAWGLLQNSVSNRLA